jgi:hypothetical protein
MFAGLSRPGTSGELYGHPLSNLASVAILQEQLNALRAVSRSWSRRMVARPVLDSTSTR